MSDHEPFQLYNIAYLICRRPAGIFCSQFGKNAKFQMMTLFSVQRCYFGANLYIASFADRVSICGSTDAIDADTC